MAEVAITGANGFIGKHLVRRLEKLGADTVSILGSSAYGSRSNHVRMDITHFDECVRFISRYNPKIIFHLAAQPLVETAKRHPFDTMEVNVRGAYNLLEAVRQAGNPSVIVWMSTDKVYGENANAIETDNLDGVGHPYNASKMVGDILARSYADVFGLPIVVIRSGNVYGESDLHWDRLIPGTSRSLVKGHRPDIRSNGNLKRDYIYVDDVINGLILASTAFVRKDIKAGTIVNLGSDTSYSVMEVVDELIGLSGHVDLTPVIQNRVTDEIEVQHMNWDFAREHLSWWPQVGLKIGLEQTFAWYKSYFGDKR